MVYLVHLQCESHIKTVCTKRQMYIHVLFMYGFQQGELGIKLSVVLL